MKRMEAYGYLKALLEGVDPLTGELLPDDHVCCDENVCEAIEMATKALCSMKDEWFGTLNAEPVRKKQRPQTDEQADAGWVKKNGKLSIKGQLSRTPKLKQYAIRIPTTTPN